MPTAWAGRDLQGRDSSGFPVIDDEGPVVDGAQSFVQFMQKPEHETSIAPFPEFIEPAWPAGLGRVVRAVQVSDPLVECSHLFVRVDDGIAGQWFTGLEIGRPDRPLKEIKLESDRVCFDASCGSSHDFHCKA